jgi:pyruvate/2-oxoglutarate dehydrogenase complex dihydrolipoamide dehydrogenase (E3) component
MPQVTNYDAIVLGSSRGGRLLPIALAKAGWKVALIERGHVGGTCINMGCTPTKTMVASARLAYLARRGADYGIHTGPISVDMQAIRQRKQGIVEGARLDSRAVSKRHKGWICSGARPILSPQRRLRSISRAARRNRSQRH